MRFLMQKLLFILDFYGRGSRDSSVNIATDWTAWVQFLVGGKGFFYSHSVQSVLGPAQPLTRGYQWLFLLER
jgi:hypothetical protein